MIYDDYKNSITKLIENPESAPTLATELLEKLKSDCEIFDSQVEQLKKADQKIRDLQDTNIKLFINQTSPAKKEDFEDKELTGNEFLNLFIDNKLEEENKHGNN